MSKNFHALEPQPMTDDEVRDLVERVRKAMAASEARRAQRIQLCSECHQRGHNSATCTADAHRCTTCGKAGHNARTCTPRCETCGLDCEPPCRWRFA